MSYEHNQAVIFSTPARGGRTPERTGTYQGLTEAKSGKGGGQFVIVSETVGDKVRQVRVRPASVRAA